MFINMLTAQLSSVPTVPIFAEQVRGVSKLKRPACLNFKTKSDSKSYEIVELLKHTKFPTIKIGLPNWNCRHERPKCQFNALN